MVLALGFAGLVLGVLLLALAPRLDTRFLLPVMVAGIAATSIGIVFCHTTHIPYVLFYAWISAEAWYLLDRRGGMFLTGLAVIASGPTIAVAGAGDGDALSWWLMVVGTLVVVSGLAALLRLRSDDLIERLERAAAHDELTGLLNRRGYQQRLDAELARAEREGTLVSRTQPERCWPPSACARRSTPACAVRTARRSALPSAWRPIPTRHPIATRCSAAPTGGCTPPRMVSVTAR